MADTRRLLPALQARLADNTSGDISPQDVRDSLVSTYPDVFNVKNWGAKGDNVADDTAAIQAALDASNALVAGSGVNHGPKIYFPRGAYRVSSTLNWSQCGILGDGPFESRVYWDGAAGGTMFDNPGGRGRGGIEKIRLTGGDNNVGKYIDWTDIETVDWGNWIRDVFFDDWDDTLGVAAVHITGLVNCQFHSVRFGGGKGYCIKIDTLAASQRVFDFAQLTVDFTNATNFQGVLNVEMSGTTGQPNINITGGRIESTTPMVSPAAIVAITEAASGDLGVIPAHIVLNNLGIQVTGGDDDQVLVHQNTTGSASAASLLILNCSLLGIDEIRGGTWAAGSEAPNLPGTSHTPFFAMGRVGSGIDIANQNHWYFEQLNIRKAMLLSGTGAPESSVTAPVGSVYFRQNGGADSALYVKETGATNTGWAAVPGVKVEGNGTGSITSGGTTDVITHGLGVTPAAANISITLTENPTNSPGAVWVDTIGGTNFTVNCENDPGESNLDFSWQAIVI